MESYLNKIIAHKIVEVNQLCQEVDSHPNHFLNVILSQARLVETHFSEALRGSKLSVVAEVKRRSPSFGHLSQIENPIDLAFKYCQGKASAISVLTDEKFFGGTLQDLANVSGMLALHYPKVSLLRKDFIIHPLQIAQARHAGANAILLIAAAVGKKLGLLMHVAKNMGLEVLTEVHDRADLELALEAQADIIGINHRNLTTFEIDLKISEELIKLIPSQVIKVAESGIYQASQAKQMKDLGFDAILVGEALVKSPYPDQLIKQMRGNS